MPYDRAHTTMSVFPLCPECHREYEDPANRRFHAESIACPDCGPRLFLEDGSGRRMEGDALARARLELSGGSIVAVRGIGGFLLAADAFQRDTLVRLRERKQRPHKPFAVMARSLEAARRYGIVEPPGETLLASAAAPILILDVKPEWRGSDRLPLDLLSPDAATLGIMLPTSPLHKLLFEPLAGDPCPPFDLLVMTSGNRRDEPTCISNAEARERLGRIADWFLLHDREINLRNDDSLCVIRHGGVQVWRRARGYAPDPILLRRPLSRCVLAIGAEIKNTVALGFEDRVVISPHVGDLETPEALDGMNRVAECLPAFLDQTPEVVAVDLHPDMHATRMGARISQTKGVPLIRVQHHHAHAVAALTEHGREAGLGLVFDGNGLGTDGTVWGAELLDVRADGFRRLASFEGVPLPGGDAAVRRPVRQLVARWVHAGVAVSDEWRERLCLREAEVAVWSEQTRRRLHAPFTHAAGRLFDAFSALLGFAPSEITYEGQPPIRLESAARRGARDEAPTLPFSVVERDDMLFVDWSPAFAMLADTAQVTGREIVLAMSLHEAVVRAALAMVEYGADRSPARVMAISGGVFMNRILNELLIPRLERKGMEVLIHRRSPPNDGCLSLGQAVIAGQ
jgi:hydrogenase maturation protein HypF